MEFLKKIGEFIFGSSSGELRDPDGIYLYIKCDKCGAPVRIRADKRHDLQRDFDTGNYVLRKEIMDGSCFSLMYATVHFNAHYQITSQEVEGGEFITWEAYKALTQPSATEETAQEESP